MAPSIALAGLMLLSLLVLLCWRLMRCLLCTAPGNFHLRWTGNWNTQCSITISSARHTQLYRLMHNHCLQGTFACDLVPIACCVSVCKCHFAFPTSNWHLSWLCSVYEKLTDPSFRSSKVQRGFFNVIFNRCFIYLCAQITAWMFTMCDECLPCHSQNLQMPLHRSPLQHSQ